MKIWVGGGIDFELFYAQFPIHNLLLVAIQTFIGSVFHAKVIF